MSIIVRHSHSQILSEVKQSSSDLITHGAMMALHPLIGRSSSCSSVDFTAASQPVSSLSS